jgi:hypothetical protein
MQLTVQTLIYYLDMEVLVCDGNIVQELGNIQNVFETC